ncbi:SGNH/GDSL hydrolase family protein [Caulobacter hibisci]|uniref:SGNH/GDSL hydrolase family protein n=1 Tax=Caulobacter hibisci TaxID=2035993 RepID=A0ABS0SSX1_9CAUL|nr:SGNH/GDSL hydrolase family protein [Caulobacter hibisci]MBI1682752.1 SGNH/GDSL hydrolase family protein [Caulobacter hibisci]
MNRRLLIAAGLALPGLAMAQTPPSEEEVRLHTDWPWLARYRDANATDAALPVERRRCVFIGDSITQGWKDARPSFFADNGFLGRGIGGQTTPQMLLRFTPDVVALKPAAVHILAGTNDIAGNTGPFDPVATRNNLSAMVALAKAAGIRVILGSITPAATYPWKPALYPDVEIPRLNAWIKAFAAEQGAVFADYTAVMDDGRAGMKPGLAYDQVHPTQAGYAVMEPVALAAVKTALG